MPIDPEELCVELECCPLNDTVPVIIVVEALLVEVGNPSLPAPNNQNELLTESYENLLS